MSKRFLNRILADIEECQVDPDTKELVVCLGEDDYRTKHIKKVLYTLLMHYTHPFLTAYPNLNPNSNSNPTQTNLLSPTFRFFSFR